MVIPQKLNFDENEEVCYFIWEGLREETLGPPQK